MKEKKYIILIVLLLNSILLIGQTDSSLDKIFRNSYGVFELQRLPNGMYRDSKLFTGTDYHPISISNTGMGLIALCIADAMGWESDAKSKIIKTLASINGNTAGFRPDRTPNGYFRHFINVTTGDQEWDSEYSTIDTAILMAGALFAEKYFNDTNVSSSVHNLLKSIDFIAAIADDTTGKIYLSIDAFGQGLNNSITSPYSEYMLVAWLAKNTGNDVNEIAENLWNNFYSNPSNLPKINYENIDLLTDSTTRFLSSFVHQFNYYLCNYFTTSTAYLNYFKNSLTADKAWWNNVDGSSSEWGLGAGSSISTSYHADAINNNPDVIVSPHIIAGYIPINLSSKNDLIYLWNNNLGTYNLPSANSAKVLWRYSKINSTWMPNEIIGVDYALMLFGISVLPEYLGARFFEKYNDYFTGTNLGVIDSNFKNNIAVYPNPTSGFVKIDLSEVDTSFSIYISDLTGKLVYKSKHNKTKILEIDLNIQPGIYFLNINSKNKTIAKKLIIN